MVEAVGHNYFPDYLAALDMLLAPNGVAVLQAITMPEARYAEYIHSADFINTVRGASGMSLMRRGTESSMCSCA